MRNKSCAELVCFLLESSSEDLNYGNCESNDLNVLVWGSGERVDVSSMHGSGYASVKSLERNEQKQVLNKNKNYTITLDM